MTNWTTPHTYVADEVPDETHGNTYWRDNPNHLYENKPYTLIPGLAGSPDRAGEGGAGTSEEWGTTTTGLTWSPSSPTTVDSHTTVPSFLYIANQADTTERLGTKSWAPAGAFDARLGHVLMGANSSVAAVTGVFGLYIADSGDTNRVKLQQTFTYNTGATTVGAYTYATGAYNLRGSVTTIPTVPTYLRITRDGSNNVSFYWSTNGVLWNFLVTQAFTFTVAKIGVLASGNTTAAFQCAADWLRTSV